MYKCIGISESAYTLTLIWAIVNSFGDFFSLSHFEDYACHSYETLFTIFCTIPLPFDEINLGSLICDFPFSVLILLKRVFWSFHWNQLSAFRLARRNITQIINSSYTIIPQNAGKFRDCKLGARNPNFPQR